MGTEQQLRGAKAARLRKLCGFLESNLHRMHYDQYLLFGYPIATGVIEGACRHIIKDRMERAGMRWKVPGAQAMLELRTHCHCASVTSCRRIRADLQGVNSF